MLLYAASTAPIPVCSTATTPSTITLFTPVMSSGQLVPTGAAATAKTTSSPAKTAASGNGAAAASGAAELPRSGSTGASFGLSVAPSPSYANPSQMVMGTLAAPG